MRLKAELEVLEFEKQRLEQALITILKAWEYDGTPLVGAVYEAKMNALGVLYGGSDNS